MSTKKTGSKRRAPAKTNTKKRRVLFAWPYVVFILLCVGVLLTGWTFQTGAADLNVTAKIAAPPLTEPAIITSPTEGARFSQVPITVKGTCPLDSYVNIYTNNHFRGSVICTASKTFQLDNVDLFTGANALKARVFNITDDEGPQSPVVNVHFEPPGPEVSQPTSPSAVPVEPFLIKTNFKYVGYSVGQSIKWTFDVSGGTSPYAVNIDWGDGTSSVVMRKGSGQFTSEHIYKEQGDGPRNSYIIKVTGSDSEERKTYLQLFVVINPSNIGSIVANTIPPKPPISDAWFFIIWPAYIIVILMTISFYLGEKEEFLILKKRGILRARKT